ncbi:hypothetical protein [Prochlorococcus sp. MIT 1300]|uniref:hypothetical protein n=1 Tax=Prochlorococcus sp. MIT 1300 TaxID=3096218 RepID=UPI002A74E1D7|nr:hypothetical protein [Prochlorococcus sp. MIT 1300]
MIKETGLLSLDIVLLKLISRIPSKEAPTKGNTGMIQAISIGDGICVAIWD